MVVRESHREVWEFVRHCHDQRGVAPSTIEGYLSAVVRQARVKQDRVIVVPQLFRDWIRRMKQLPRAMLKRAPVTKELVWAAATRTRVSWATRLALVMAYYTGMRLGELVSKKVHEYERMFTVRRCDVHFDVGGKFVKFVNRGGKSDPMNKGTSRFMMAAAHESQFCPVLFIREFLDATMKTSKPTDPLLQHADGNMVVRRHVVDLLKRVAGEQGVDPATIMGHSIRIGAATQLAEAGLSFHDIMMFGGWLTETACMKYLRWTEERLRVMSEALALSSTPRAPSTLLAMAMAADKVAE